MIRSYSYSKTPDLFIHLPLLHGIKMHNIWPRWHTHFQMLFIAFAGQPLNQQTQTGQIKWDFEGKMCKLQLLSSLYPQVGCSAGSLLSSCMNMWYQIRYQNRLKCCNLSWFQHLESGFESSLECKSLILSLFSWICTGYYLWKAPGF